MCLTESASIEKPVEGDDYEERLAPFLIQRIPARLKRLVKRDAERNKIMVERTNWKEIVRVKRKIV